MTYKFNKNHDKWLELRNRMMAWEVAKKVKADGLYTPLHCQHKYLVSEQAEYAEAIEANDKIEVADGLADIMFVAVNGEYLAALSEGDFGLQTFFAIETLSCLVRMYMEFGVECSHDILDEVIKNNYLKLETGTIGKDAKLEKHPNHPKPDIASIIQRHKTHGAYAAYGQPL